MRSTLDLPDTLIHEAMSLTKIQKKTELIKYALENVIQREKIKGLTEYFGKVNLDIDLNKLRNRWIILLILPRGLNFSGEIRNIILWTISFMLTRYAQMILFWLNYCRQLFTEKNTAWLTYWILSWNIR